MLDVKNLDKFASGDSLAKQIDLDPDQSVEVTFEFYELDSWDDESMYVDVNGSTINLGTFNHKFDEGNRSGTQLGVEWSIKSGERSKFDDTAGWNDQVHYVTLKIPAYKHDGKVDFKFHSDLDGDVRNESFAIGNFSVTREQSSITDGERHVPSRSNSSTRTAKNEDDTRSIVFDPIRSSTDFSGGQLSGRAQNHIIAEGLQRDNGNVKLTFDFYELGTWDSEKLWMVINDTEISLGEFNWKSTEFATKIEQPNSVPSGVSVERVASSGNLDLHYLFRSSSDRSADQIHRYEVTISEDALNHVLEGGESSAAVTFKSNLDSRSTNEAFGIANFSTIVNSAVENDNSPINNPVESDQPDANNDFQNGPAFHFGKYSNFPFAAISSPLAYGRFGIKDEPWTIIDVDTWGFGTLLSFDFLEIDSWDNEYFFIHINNIKINLGKFAHRALEGGNIIEQDGFVIEKARSELIEGPDLFNKRYGEELHRFTVKIPENIINKSFLGDTLEIKFSSTLNESLNNESFAISDLRSKAFPRPQDNNQTEPEGDQNEVDISGLNRYQGGLAYSAEYYANDRSKSAVISFDFYRLDSWDDESLILRLNGEDFILGSFYWKETARSLSGSESGVDWEVVPIKTGNFAGSNRSWTDTLYRVEVVADKLSEGVLDISLRSNTNSSVNDESWAIENLVVVERDIDPKTPNEPIGWEGSEFRTFIGLFQDRLLADIRSANKEEFYSNWDQEVVKLQRFQTEASNFLVNNSEPGESEYGFSRMTDQQLVDTMNMVIPFLAGVGSKLDDYGNAISGFFQQEFKNEDRDALSAFQAVLPVLEVMAFVGAFGLKSSGSAAKWSSDTIKSSLEGMADLSQTVMWRTDSFLDNFTSDDSFIAEVSGDSIDVVQDPPEDQYGLYDISKLLITTFRNRDTVGDIDLSVAARNYESVLTDYESVYVEFVEKVSYVATLSSIDNSKGRSFSIRKVHDFLDTLLSVDDELLLYTTGGQEKFSGGSNVLDIPFIWRLGLENKSDSFKELFGDERVFLDFITGSEGAEYNRNISFADYDVPSGRQIDKWNLFEDLPPYDFNL